ncbi:response regulator transcription factor [Streptomyces erythrochromogenes]|uniref:response regulator transcription factor n=1 Tax=Streptomyces erythrochromogenes TaxID=285574 RepID=UPI003414E5B6
MAHVLLIEDDDLIRCALTRALERLGHRVVGAGSGTEGLTEALKGGIDIIVLDLGLPDIDGIQVLKMLRASLSIPVVIATARDEETQTVTALHLGADDYVIKPFSVEHLDARMTAVLRRTQPDPLRPPLRVGDLMVDLNAHTASLGSRLLELRPKEFALLAYLVERSGRMISKAELRAEVWHNAFGVTDKTVDVHLSWLRRRLGESAVNPRYLHTVRGVGVKLQAPSAA